MTAICGHRPIAREGEADAQPPADPQHKDEGLQPVVIRSPHPPPRT